MALKDWKKVKNYWIREKNGRLTIVEIIEENYPKKLYVVRIRTHYATTMRVDTIFKEFRSKKQALSFVKDYMKKH